MSLQLRPPEPLSASHRLDDFDCGEAALDDWLKRRALANQSSGASRSFVVVDQDGFVRGYYAMAAGAVSHQFATGGVRRNMPDATVEAFRFKAVRPTFDLNPFRVNGQLQNDGTSVKLWAQDHEGWLTMDAIATLRGA